MSCAHEPSARRAQLPPLGERRQAAHAADGKLADARARALRHLRALVLAQGVLPAAELLEPRDLHLQAGRRLRGGQQAEGGLALLQQVVERHQSLDEARRRAPVRPRVELDLAVVQRLREGVAPRRDVGEGARVHRELALVALEILGERQ